MSGGGGIIIDVPALAGVTANNKAHKQYAHFFAADDKPCFKFGFTRK